MLNQNKLARIRRAPIRSTNLLNLNMVNWALTLGNEKAEPRRQGSAIFCADGVNAADSRLGYFDACALRAAISASVRNVIAPILLLR
jgi:hypothetical protein